MNRLKTTRFFNRYALAALCIPMLILLGVLVANAISPFGGNLFVPIDLYHQYLPVMAEIQRKLHAGESLFYTWNGGGGMNFIPLLAYHGSSPLTLLLLWLFPENLLVECEVLLTVLKVGLSGWAMCVFLQKEDRLQSEDPDGSGILTAALACCYALSAYTVGYYWNVMWLDGVVMLPLVALGLSRLIEGDGWVFYTVSLAVLMFSNYYIAAMICMFLVPLALAMYFEQTREGGVRGFAKMGMRFVGASLFACALAAAILLPTYLGIRQAQGFLSAAPTNLLSLQVSPLVMLLQLLPNAMLTTMSGPPNIACVLIVLLLLGFYLANPEIPLREKGVNVALALFVAAAMAVVGLDYAWNLFHIPNQIPYRCSFALCFVLVRMAHRAALHLEAPSLPSIVLAAFCGAGLFGAGYVVLGDALENKTIFIVFGLLLVVLYVATLGLWHGEWATKRMAASMLAALAVLELAFTTFTGITVTGHTLRDIYLGDVESVAELAQTADDEHFSRIDLVHYVNSNSPFLCGYRGVSVFASSTPASHAAFVSKIGIPNTQLIRYIYHAFDPVLDAILNVNYNISADALAAGDKQAEGRIEGTSSEENAALAESFDEVRSAGRFHLWKSQTPMSVAYVVPDSISTWDTSLGSAEAVEDDFVRAATGGTYASRDNWANAYALLADSLLEVDSWDASRISGNVAASSDGVLLTSIFADDGWAVEIDGEAVEPIEPVGGALLAVPISAGEHHVEMHFRAPGTIAGALVSGGAVVALVVLLVRRILIKEPVLD